MTQRTSPSWSELLIEAVERPGLILEACRRIAPGPIATVRPWNELGRRVRRGESAISLCMPT